MTTTVAPVPILHQTHTHMYTQTHAYTDYTHTHKHKHSQFRPFEPHNIQSIWWHQKHASLNGVIPLRSSRNRG